MHVRHIPLSWHYFSTALHSLEVIGSLKTNADWSNYKLPIQTIIQANTASYVLCENKDQRALTS